jgi:hypothetical protein
VLSADAPSQRIENVLFTEKSINANLAKEAPRPSSHLIPSVSIL